MKVFLGVFSPSAAAGCEPSRSRRVEGRARECNAQLHGHKYKAALLLALPAYWVIACPVSGKVEVSESAGLRPPCLFFGV